MNSGFCMTTCFTFRKIHLVLQHFKICFKNNKKNKLGFCFRSFALGFFNLLTGWVANKLVVKAKIIPPSHTIYLNLFWETASSVSEKSACFFLLVIIIIKIILNNYTTIFLKNAHHLFAHLFS